MRRATPAAAIVVVAVLVGPAGATGGTATAVGSDGPIGETGPPEAAIECEYPFTATDATGTEVTVESEPEAVVTLNPSAAQTMWEIGGKDRVVGVSEYATYLDGAETRTNISAGGQSFVSVETVVDLDPDLVLAPNTIPNGTVDKLREAGLTVYKFSFQRSLDDIKQKTLRTGQLTGECDGAEETVAWMNEELQTVREAVRGQERPRVLYVFFRYTGGTGTFAHTVIETAGGTNVAAEANISGYEPISQEVVAASDPEWIVVNDGAMQVPKTEAYNDTYAVRNDQIVVLQEEYISQPAPRIVRSVVKLAKTFHPRAYEQAARRTPTESATSTETQPPTEMQTPTPTVTETSAGGPGFGPVRTALAFAFALAVLLVRRPRE